MKLNNKLKDLEYPFLGVTHTREIVRGIVLNEDNKVAILKIERDDIFGKTHYYETPGGGVNEDEDINKAIIREIKEETGFNSEIICEIS